MGSRGSRRWGLFIDSEIIKNGWQGRWKVWGRWNGQSRWIRKIVEFDGRIFFVDGRVWIVPANGGEGADVDVSSRRGWLVSEKAMNGESDKD